MSSLTCKTTKTNYLVARCKWSVFIGGGHLRSGGIGKTPQVSVQPQEAGGSRCIVCSGPCLGVPPPSVGPREPLRRGSSPECPPGFPLSNQKQQVNSATKDGDVPNDGDINALLQTTPSSDDKLNGAQLEGWF